MKIDALNSSHSLHNQQSIQPPTSISSSSLGNAQFDPLMATLNPYFYQQLQKESINTPKDVLNFLKNFDVKNEGNQTLKEKRQLALLTYTHQKSELEQTENKEIINQALLSYLSFQGIYHQFVLEMTGMIENQEEYAEFFKPDRTTFSL
ncbi:MAG TPA: hypothetical protein DEV59_10320 [Proteus sp.]|nr:hypothetical protein [Proteus sp. (in: enterobacteria)]